MHKLNTYFIHVLENLWVLHQVSEEGFCNINFLFIEVRRSQEIQLTPAKVRSSEKPPPEPPPHVNIKRVQSVDGCEFYRCFITKFSKSMKYIDQLLYLDATINFINACLETFCRIKTTFDAKDFIFGGEIMFEKAETPPFTDSFWR